MYKCSSSVYINITHALSCFQTVRDPGALAQLARPIMYPSLSWYDLVFPGGRGMRAGLGIEGGSEVKTRGRL